VFETPLRLYCINVPLVESVGLKPCGFEAWFWSRRCGYIVGLASRKEGLVRWTA
jgi:hypothetical protein